MSGFIALTSDEWFDYHVEKGHNKVVFWTNRLIHLEKGTKFLFLGGIGQKDRYIQGYAKIEDSGTCSVNDLWNKFGVLCGADSLEDLSMEISKETSKKLIDAPDKISYWLLNNFTNFEKLVYPTGIDGEGRKQQEVFVGDVPFPKNQQIGKKISIEQAEEIIKDGLTKQDTH